MIEFENVSFRYDPKTDYVLNDITFKINKAEFVAIVGKNGAGKTTLIKHFNGLLKPNEGIVRIDGLDIAKEPISKMASIIGYSFQNPNHQLFAQNVKKELEFGPNNLKVEESTRDTTIQKLVDTFQINHLLERSPFELSGGERRLVSIASVLTMNQQVLVLDEPTYGQDYRQKKRLGSFLKKLTDEGITVVVVSHDMDFILDFIPRTIVLSGGKIVADGETSKVLSDQTLLQDTDLISPLLLDLCKSIQQIDDSFTISINEQEVYENILALISKDRKISR
ncbi:MAG: energy-coupling factor ABC transporter ATP-binding protein [Candidatus Heimdallarchaeota archaeon]